MKATSLSDLLSFEKHFEDSSISFLSTATGIPAFPATGGDFLITPRLEVLFSSSGAELPYDQNGEFLKYNASFEVGIVTDFALEQDREIHLGIVGSVRKELLQCSDNWNFTNLPYYSVKLLRPNATMREVDGEIQRTILSFEIKFRIKEEAFPG